MTEATPEFRPDDHVRECTEPATHETRYCIVDKGVARVHMLRPSLLAKTFSYEGLLEVPKGTPFRPW